MFLVDAKQQDSRVAPFLFPPCCHNKLEVDYRFPPECFISLLRITRAQ